MSESIESIKEILEANGFVASGTETSPHRKGSVLHMFEHGSIEGASAVMRETTNFGLSGNLQVLTLTGEVPYSDELRDAVYVFNVANIGGDMPTPIHPIYKMRLRYVPGEGLDFCRRFTSAMVEQLAKGVKE